MRSFPKKIFVGIVVLLCIGVIAAVTGALLTVKILHQQCAYCGVQQYIRTSFGQDIGSELEYDEWGTYESIRKASHPVCEHIWIDGLIADGYSHGWTPIHHYAAVRNHESLKEAIENQPASINAKDDFGRTPLHWAVLRRDKEGLAILLAHNADPDRRSEEMESPRQLARRIGWAMDEN